MRIPYVANPPPTATPEDADIVARIQARRAPRPLIPLDLALLHSPPLADGWNAFLGAVRTRGTLPTAVRELLVCRVAAVNKAWHEWDAHAPLSGLSEAALEVVGCEDIDGEGVEERGKGLLGEDLWAALRYADEMTRKVEVADGTFETLRGFFDERGLVEITTTVACYNCVSRFLVALNVGERNGTGPGGAKK
ncbi:carboxymuconolactone decarboxylase [Xylaria sp. CBS 124048]|nr:carboxymuconolactone decarboxylase [Xylaria sp. CBS 124048]